jgi:nucleoside-diphosphate-sugar epimerase
VAHLGPDAATFLGSPSDRVTPVFFEITDDAAVERLISGCDAVIHLAGPPSVAESLERPLAYVRAHVLGTATVLEAMRNAGIRTLVYVSSAEVYGECAMPVKETHPISPRSPYGAAKAAAEQLVRASVAYQSLNGYIIRPFCVYGRGMPEASLIATILRQADEGREILVRDLTPVRDFCFVDDLAALIARAAVTPRDDVVALNAAYGKGYSVSEVIAEVSTALNRPLVGKDADSKRGPGVEIHRLVADVTAAQNELNWRARYDLQQGIRQFRRFAAAR